MVEVNDNSKINDSGTERWKDDAVEVYIDGDNSKASSYDNNDYQYLFRYNDTEPFESKQSAISGVEFSSMDTDSGYNVEVSIPWSTIGVSPGEGHLIGTDIQINDDDDGGGRDNKKS